MCAFVHFFHTYRDTVTVDVCVCIIMYVCYCILLMNDRMSSTVLHTCNYMPCTVASVTVRYLDWLWVSYVFIITVNILTKIIFAKYQILPCIQQWHLHVCTQACTNNCFTIYSLLYLLKLNDNTKVKTTAYIYFYSWHVFMRWPTSAMEKAYLVKDMWLSKTHFLK